MRALTKRERIGALVVDALELEEYTHLMHHYQEKVLVRGPPWFGDVETSSIDFGNYLNSLFILHAFIDDF